MSDFLDKKQLRLEALRSRDAIGPILRAEASMALALHLAALDPRPDDIVAGYMPIRSEIDPRPLMHALAAGGMRLCSPALLDRTTLVFREMIKGAPLVDTGFGTVGPGPEAAEVRPNLILLPLAGFDRYGNRLGYGAGHYDRVIAAMHGSGHRPRLIGLAFAAQELPAIPAEEHDIRLDGILTENGLRQFEAHA